MTETLSTTDATLGLDPEETMSRDQIEALQLARLQDTVAYAYERVPLYREKYDAAGVHPSDLKELSDLAKFPFTDKEDLRRSYPFGMFAVPQEQVARIHASSGTTGRATVVGYTQQDLDDWASDFGPSSTPYIDEPPPAAVPAPSRPSRPGSTPCARSATPMHCADGSPPTPTWWSSGLV